MTNIATVENFCTTNGSDVELVLSLTGRPDMVIYCHTRNRASFDTADITAWSGPYLGTREPITAALVSLVREAWEDWCAYDAPRNLRAL